jgi:glycolate oxidase FAD binding subunit
MSILPTSVAELQAAIVDAQATSTALRIEGAGTWLSAGRPVSAARHLSTRQLRGVVEYTPGDLVLTVRAGTTLEEIADVTAPHGQWLALEPYATPDGVKHGTIGATIATSSQGPLALGFGRARDLILGVSFVTGDGTHARAGGRVVKNVAGFDLVRLVTGAWGTLGVVSEVSLRLHARPAVDETFAIGLSFPIDVTQRDTALAQLVEQLNSAPLLPVTSSLASLVLLADGAPDFLRAAHHLPDTPMVLLARATGNRTRVDAQRRALGAIGAVVPVDSVAWRTLRAFESGNTTVRASRAPSSTAHTLRDLVDWSTRHQATQRRTVIEPMRGAIRMSCAVADADGANWSLPIGGIAERLPATAWTRVAAAVDDPISTRLRDTMDPSRILNRGILGEASVIATPTAVGAST